MNKRIFFLLLPLLAALCFVNCRAHYGMHGSDTGALKYSGNPGVKIHSLGARNDISHKDKNAIRIKAWDDAAFMVMPTVWRQKLVIIYEVCPGYFEYASGTASTAALTRQLRGPPMSV